MDKLIKARGRPHKQLNEKMIGHHHVVCSSNIKLF